MTYIRKYNEVNATKNHGRGGYFFKIYFLNELYSKSHEGYTLKVYAYTVCNDTLNIIVAETLHLDGTMYLPL